MFETVRLLGSDETELALQTRRSRQIRNAQAAEVVTDKAREVFARLSANHGRWEPRKPACGVYNCSGHVWASRRTAIYEESEIEKILADDGYRALRDERPTISDLVLYYVNNTLYHVGVVFEFRRLDVIVELGDTREVDAAPWVLSKWNDSSGEVLHHVNDVPWADCEVKFITDRR